MPNDVMMIVLGWILGIFSHVVVEDIGKMRTRVEVEKAIKTELEELRLKYILMIYLVDMQLGTLDRNLLNWLRPIVEKYRGAYTVDIQPLLQGIQILVDFDDAQLTAYVAMRSSEQRPLSLKKYSVPYLESKMTQLSLFPEKTQNIFLSIKAHVELVNQEIDLSRFYMEKTFDSGMDSANHAIVRTNFNERCVFAAQAAKTTVDLINKLDEPA